MTARNLEITILPGEAGDWEFLYKSKGDVGRSNVIADFFTDDSPDYIGNLSHVSPLICGHSYWTTEHEGMRHVRAAVATAVQGHILELWQREWSMLGDGY